MKIIRKIFACILAAAVMCSFIATVGASGTGNVLTLDDIKPKAGSTVNVSDVMEAAKDKMYYVTLNGLGNSTKLDEYCIAELNKAGLDVFMNGLKANNIDDAVVYGVVIGADQVAKLASKTSFDFGVGIVKTDTDYVLIVGKTVTDVELPEGAYIIMPVASGDFGFEFDINFKATDKYKYLYYIKDDGEIQDASKVLLSNSNGDITITLSHASAYILTTDEIEDAVAYKAPTSSGNSSNTSSNSGSGNAGTENPNTGVALPIALVALAGGSVAVSAIVAKKRK